MHLEGMLQRVRLVARLDEGQRPQAVQHLGVELDVAEGRRERAGARHGLTPNRSAGRFIAHR